VSTPAHSYQVKTEEEDVVLGQLLQVLLDDVWWMIGIALFIVLAAGAYCTLARPVYSADAHVRVEESDNTSQALTQTQTGASINATTGALPTDSEIEMIKSRGVVAPVVAQCRLNFSVSAMSFPVLGNIAAHLAKPGKLSKPWFGLNSYAWGGEEIGVDSVEVVPALENRDMVLTALGDGRYSLAAPDNGGVLLEGRAGTLASGNGVSINVTKLLARPGTRFKVLRANDLDAIAGFQSAIKVEEQGKQTGVIQISLENENPERAAQIANALANSYLHQHIESKQADATKMLEYLQSEQPRLKGDLERAESALTEYQSKSGSINASDEAKVYLEGSINYESQIAGLRLQIATLEQRFGDSHPALIVAQQQMSQLQAEREKFEQRFRNLPTSEVKAVALQRDEKVAEDIYVLLLNRVQELSVQKAGTGGNVHIVDAALRPGSPTKPKKFLIMSAAVILGLIIGAGFVFMRRAMFKGIVDPDKVERLAGLPLFGLVPMSAEQVKIDTEGKRDRDRERLVPILATVRPNDVCVEIMRSLRTSMQFALMEARNHVVMLTGPASGVGKSFLTTNLAVLLAASGKKVLLIDADMRRGKLERAFGMERANGLAELLAGTVGLEQAIRTTRTPLLSFMPAGKRPENPSELLMSPRLQQYLEGLGRVYDVVFIDTPPVLAVTDASIIGKLAGTNFLVLRSGAHNELEISEAIRRLRTAGIPLQGAIMNGMTQRSRGYNRGNYAAVEEYLNV
jgi:tyrosine-protein kinase Etk/Wzc